ncbi:MAG: 50S ribosomal protein L6 [Anaerolineaceae bacterium]|nr:50S ribosomal protein L6 [Anaerolineaceae bacterium]
MSRIGKLPVEIPPGIDVELKGSHVLVKGPKGTLERSFSPLINIKREAEQIIVTRDSDEKYICALHGTTRAVIQNMVTGVNTGYSKILEIQGVGYKAELKDKDLVINVGFSHSVDVKAPDGIEFIVTGKNRIITIKGVNKEVVGQIAADIRKIRPPEPYKGKGIRYKGERVRRKAGKTAAAI